MPREIAERHDVIPMLGEIFREHGFSGTSLSEITHRTGLGKGSLYHFFPNGKKEMAEAVLDDVATWFETNVFAPLRKSKDPELGIKKMFEAVDRYFYSGKRICLVGAFALYNTRDQFGTKVNAYFSSWTKTLTAALKRNGLGTREARETAEDIVASIQGALVLARSQDDPMVFTRALKRLQNRAVVGSHE
ncbi:MAG TPA: TetR/AcrR family transcriptional regulator [Sulfuricaulis sp.]|nr:TetR/AcrR family transcriptional regulator [Gammaproteobacteria bacterium]MDH3466765.1 TetR/AcrR family transcriptional regulator [Gammaproteobacteria bacterium]HEU5338368.1 TetR/AcrR family transcriptional regulator [Sulfuricaulis sp.]